MYIQKVALRNFRCFENFSLAVPVPLLVITGPNGAGKTAFLEALGYACYLKSFRGARAIDIIRHGASTATVSLIIEDSVGQQTMVQIGFSDKERVIKIDKVDINSHRKILNYYRVITLSNEDMNIIHGSPDERRAFIDQALLLLKPDAAEIIKKFRAILQRRNAFLSQLGAQDDHLYEIWSQHLWETSCQITTWRKELLARISNKISHLLSVADCEVTITFSYKSKGCLDQFPSFEAFREQLVALKVQEQKWKRSLFGAHLDDIEFHFNDKKSKKYASRGQQKLILALIKIALAQEIAGLTGSYPVILIDDFFSELDIQRATLILRILRDSTNSQLVITATELHPALQAVVTGFNGAFFNISD